MPWLKCESGERTKSSEPAFANTLTSLVMYLTLSFSRWSPNWDVGYLQCSQNTKAKFSQSHKSTPNDMFKLRLERGLR